MLATVGEPGYSLSSFCLLGDWKVAPGPHCSLCDVHSRPVLLPLSPVTIPLPGW